jgi:hypothetical protein
VVAEKVLPSRFEKQTLYVLDRRRLLQKEQVAAVRLLQCAFREALRRRHLSRDRQTMRVSSSPRQQIRDEEEGRSIFIVQFAQRRKEFAKCAQLRTELDDNMELNGILPPEPDQTQQQMVNLLQQTQHCMHSLCLCRICTMFVLILLRFIFVHLFLDSITRGITKWCTYSCFDCSGSQNR